MPLWLVVLAGQHGLIVLVTYRYAYMTYIVRVTTCSPGQGISWQPPSYSFVSSAKLSLCCLSNLRVINDRWQLVGVKLVAWCDIVLVAIRRSASCLGCID